MKKTYIIICLLSICFTSFAQKRTSVLYNKDFDFKSLKTFDFSESSYALGKKFNQKPYIAKALIEHLDEKGLKKVKVEPDAIVDVSISFKKGIKIDEHPRTMYYRYHTTPVPGLRYVGTVYAKSLKARLVINIIDQKSNQTVWTGVCIREPNLDVTPAKREKKIAKIIRKMFKKYPVK